MSIPRQGTPEWYEWRKGGIGASEFPAILGMDPYKGEREIALEKRGEVEQEPETEAQRWGKRVQRMALAAYAETLTDRVRNVETSTVSKRYPHVFASLDGRIVGKRRGVEVKLTKERWDGEPPRRVIVQTQVQMGVYELDAVEVVKVGLFYSAPQVYVIERDDAMIDQLMPLGEEWYLRYVLGDELPPVDGSRATSRHLDGIHGEPEAKADLDQAALAARLQAVRSRLKAAEAEERDVVNHLKASMNGAYSLVGTGFRVTWRPTKERTTTDWKAVAHDLASDAEAFTAAVERNSETQEGTRPFRVTFEEDDR